MRSRAIEGFLIGCGKAFVVVGLTVLLPAMVFGYPLCGGECSGAGYLLFFMLPTFALAGVVGLAVICSVIFLWTHQRPEQIRGALAAAPIAVGLYVAFNYTVDSIAHAALPPQYLRRTIDHPIGKIGHIALEGIGDRRVLQSILIDGSADRVTEAYIDRTTHELKPVNYYTFRLGDPDECEKARPDSTLQREGFFDLCIVYEHATDLSDVVLIGTGWERTRRFLGPPYIATAERLVDGRPASELARWEYGPLPGRGTWVGDRFETEDFVRALTGIRSSRVAERKALNLEQRIALIHSFVGRTQFIDGAVMDYLLGAPEMDILGTSGISLSDTSRAQLSEIAGAVCASNSDAALAQQALSVDCPLDRENRYLIMLTGKPRAGT